MGLPTACFVAFLAWGARRAARRLRRARSPLMSTYYAFLWVVCGVNVLRCGVQLWQQHPEEEAPVADALWLVTRFALNFLEVSVVVFLAQGYNSSGRDALVRTLAVSGGFAAVDVALKALLMYGAGVPLFSGDQGLGAGARREKWGYWSAHTALYAAGYGLVTALPHTRWRDCLPAKASFYRYAAALAAVNFFGLCGALALVGGAGGGYCLYGGANLVYYAAYPPLLYVTFLQDFLAEDGEVDEEYYSELRDAGFFDDAETPGMY